MRIVRLGWLAPLANYIFPGRCHTAISNLGINSHNFGPQAAVYTAYNALHSIDIVYVRIQYLLILLRNHLGLAVKRCHIVLVGIIWGGKARPLYGVEGWPRNRGFLCTILKGVAIRTRVSVRFRESGRLSGVVVK